RPPSVTGLHDISLRPKEKLKHVCRVKGNPLPAVFWYKDGVRVQPSRKIRIHTKKRRSTLVIPKVRPEDAGLYRCEAKSVIGIDANSTARVTVISDTRPENTTTLWPLYGVPCPVETYCLNGGTCFYYETVGELVCQCADGYKGQRCENKAVFNRGISLLADCLFLQPIGVHSRYLQLYNLTPMWDVTEMSKFNYYLRILPPKIKKEQLGSHIQDSKLSLREEAGEG
ncbi:hypothetical protein Cfor_09269, partial [Coptotermes formosanus]